LKRVKINNNQSVWDLALQEYGSANGVLQLVIDNPGIIDFENAIPKGVFIWIDQTKIINPVVVQYFDKRKFRPSTASKDGNLAYSSGFSNGFN
jgi:phage tail protein X